MEHLFNNIPFIHTTPLGVKRIQKNLDLTDEDVVSYCQQIIQEKESYIYKLGKNYYAEYKDIVLTIHASSLTIITAHKKSIFPFPNESRDA